jgi:hypothetical protein
MPVHEKHLLVIGGQFNRVQCGGESLPGSDDCRRGDVSPAGPGCEAVMLGLGAPGARQSPSGWVRTPWLRMNGGLGVPPGQDVV